MINIADAVWIALLVIMLSVDVRADALVTDIVPSTTTTTWEGCENVKR